MVSKKETSKYKRSSENVFWTISAGFLTHVNKKAARSSCGLFEKGSCESGKRKEHKPNHLDPDIFRWGGGLPREGMGVKKFGTCPSKPSKLASAKPPGANPLVAERAPWRSSQSCVTGGQQPIGNPYRFLSHFFCTPGNPCATPIVTRGEGSFRYQGVSTRGIRHSPGKTKLFGGISWEFCQDISGVPEKFNIKKSVFNSCPPIGQKLRGSSYRGKGVRVPLGVPGRGLGSGWGGGGGVVFLWKKGEGCGKGAGWARWGGNRRRNR